MKKTTQKLSLNKKVIGRLQSIETNQVIGGVIPKTVGTACFPTHDILQCNTIWQSNICCVHI